MQSLWGQVLFDHISKVILVTQEFYQVNNGEREF